MGPGAWAPTVSWPPPADSRVQALAEVALAAALAVVLDLFKIPLPHLLYGGSVSLEGLPLVLVALRRGSGTGLAAGALYGIVNLALQPRVVHPLQPVLDYPVAFGLLGVGAGLLGGAGVEWGGRSRRRRWLRAAAGALLGNSMRLVAHFVSGVVFFASFAPAGQPAWLYSLVYNASYMVPQLLLQAALLAPLLQVLARLPRR